MFLQPHVEEDRANLFPLVPWLDELYGLPVFLRVDHARPHARMQRNETVGNGGIKEEGCERIRFWRIFGLRIFLLPGGGNARMVRCPLPDEVLDLIRRLCPEI